MNTFASRYALFLAQAATLVVAVIALVAGVVMLSRRKAERKARQHAETQPCTYLLDFRGDIRASAVAALREEISAIPAGGSARRRRAAAAGKPRRHGQPLWPRRRPAIKVRRRQTAAHRPGRHRRRQRRLPHG